MKRHRHEDRVAGINARLRRPRLVPPQPVVVETLTKTRAVGSSVPIAVRPPCGGPECIRIYTAGSFTERHAVATCPNPPRRGVTITPAPVVAHVGEPAPADRARRLHLAQRQEEVPAR